MIDIWLKENDATNFRIGLITNMSAARVFKVVYL